jgi:hypothetical protein
VTAFVVGLIYTALSVRAPSGFPDLSSDGAITGILYIAFVVSMVSLPVSAVATLALGLPVFRYLDRRGRLSAINSVAAGLAIAMALSGLLLAAHRLGSFLVDGDFDMGLVAIIAAGPLSGLALWCVARE